MNLSNLGDRGECRHGRFNVLGHGGLPVLGLGGCSTQDAANLPCVRIAKDRHRVVGVSIERIRSSVPLECDAGEARWPSLAESAAQTRIPNSRPRRGQPTACQS